MTERHLGPPSLPVRDDQPLLGVVVREEGEELTRYFADEGSADPAEVVRQARALAGAWSDLDWGEMAAEFDRIRHESRPTPSIEL